MEGVSRLARGQRSCGFPKKQCPSRELWEAQAAREKWEESRDVLWDEKHPAGSGQPGMAPTSSWGKLGEKIVTLTDRWGRNCREIGIFLRVSERMGSSHAASELLLCSLLWAVEWGGKAGLLLFLALTSW